MTKSDVNNQKLSAFVLMPDTIEIAFNTWWDSLPDDHVVDVRYPHERHGLKGKVSNNAKVIGKEAFLRFVDNNSQPNGRRLDSRNLTHYFFPKFKTISEPKRTVACYEEGKGKEFSCV